MLRELLTIEALGWIWAACTVAVVALVWHADRTGRKHLAQEKVDLLDGALRSLPPAPRNTETWDTEQGCRTTVMDSGQAPPVYARMRGPLVQL